MSLDLGDLHIDTTNVSQSELESLGLGDVKVQAIQLPEEENTEEEKVIVLEEELGYEPSLVICVPGKSFSDVFLKTWTNTISVLFSKKVKFTLSNSHSDMIHFARTLCLGGNIINGRNQKPFNGKIEYTHLLWLDPTIFHNVNQIISLLLRKVDVVAGIYKTYDENQIMAIKNMKNSDYFKKHGHFEFMTEEDIKDKKDLIEVDYCGMGFMLMTKKAVESIQYPWFYSKPTEIFGHYDILSEDIQYCLSLREQGYKIFIDPTIRVGCEKTYII